jgi:hypothetical protein
MLVGHFLDRFEIQKQNALKIANKAMLTKNAQFSSMSAIFTSFRGDPTITVPAKRYSRLNRKDGPTPFMKIVDEALPQVLSSKSFISKYKQELMRHHRWMAVIFHFTKKFPRALRVLALASNIIIMLFMQSLTYNLMHGDDGSCELLETEEACLEPASAFSGGSSMCYWNVGNDYDTDSSVSRCLYVQPDSDLRLIIFVAIFSAVMSTPIAFALDWAIQHVLSAPSMDLGKKPSSTIAPVEVITSVVPGKPPPLLRRRAAVQVIDENILIRTAQTDFDQLQKQIKLYRKQLSDTSDFDGKFTGLL